MSPALITDARQPPRTRWGQERRLEFIDFRLRWEGKINRGELVEFFGISVPQASADIALYTATAPSNLAYDKSDRVYRATATFVPAFTPPDSQAYLNQLLGVVTGSLSPSLSFIGWAPSCDVVRFPSRSIRPELLIEVVWAIRDRQDLCFTYQSMRRPAATRRWIAPHAIAFDGTRWHLRAWCHEHKDFRDFVFARIQQIHEIRPSVIDPIGDRRWNTLTTVVLRPRTGLTPGQKAAVEVDFGMEEGMLHIPIREALVFYFIRQLQLDLKDSSVLRGHPIELVNEHELTPLLLEAARP